MKTATLIRSIILFFSLSELAYGQTFSSADKQVNLIELYTSEGCSSCPPADKWLNSLKQQQGLWTEFIPVAFHVDYWDYIGWHDPYAHSAHTRRQYQYKESNNIRSVYTPAVIFNGDEWRSWRSWRRQDLPRQNAQAAGQLNIEIEQQTLTAKYQDKLPRDSHLVLNIAILGFDLTSKVNKGENTGRTLKHEFVVLGYRSVPMQATQSSGYKVKDIDLPTTSVNSARLALATWVSTSENQAPIQATGGWLNN